MPVVERIEKFDHYVEISGGLCQILNLNEEVVFEAMVNTSKIRAVWLAVVDFVKVKSEGKLNQGNYADQQNKA